ncbi:hypothetical protein D0X99_02165 [Algoriphagus lacus]|uniref:DUF3299 domain-containing protein n=2 Tax=Algoriphagus lacus TaxID=2056311 RepID=A0A418PXV5_9BACT|nr:hypothetical protein D0X99_02165 [Algoriphagus lacus]
MTLEKYRFVAWFALVILVGLSAFTAPQSRLWELFAKTTFHEKFNKAHGVYFYFPKFGSELLALQGKTVELQGFYIPLDTSPSKTLILSKYPMAECFFCGGAGPESIAVVYLKSPPNRRPKLDQILKVRGILQLNATDVEEMTFIIQNAEIIP